MSDVLFRGRGADIGGRAPAWLVRSAGAVLGLATRAAGDLAAARARLDAFGEHPVVLPIYRMRDVRHFPVALETGTFFMLSTLSPPIP